ncbi:NAD(P)-dependent oxidoreductase [Spirosoma areae]
MIPQFKSSIAILGGAGKAGRPLVEEALNSGYSVRLLLRHPDQVNLAHERLAILRGDAREIDHLRALLPGCRALLSTLGNPREAGVPILSAVTKNILTVMPEAGIRRYVTVTSLYTTGNQQQHLPTRQAADYMQQFFPQFMADRQLEYKLLSESNLDWTYVRLPYLVEEPATGFVDTNLDHLPGQQITVTDLARFLLAQLDDSRYYRKAPFVANV